MRSALLSTFTAVTLALSLNVAQAQSSGDYSAAALLAPCQEADNDSRWGDVAEMECEQYINGFVHALMESGVITGTTGICPPKQNTADEVRWAFMRWVHKSYTERKAVSAAQGLMATLKDSFPCGG